jgi:hypothetical protein
MEQEYTYHFYMRKGKKHLWATRPLHEFYNKETKQLDLQYLRDVDFMYIGKEGEKVEVGIFELKKKEVRKKLHEFAEMNRVTGVKWLFLEKMEIKVQHKRQVFDYTRGEWIVNHKKYEMTMTAFERENGEYMISNPRVSFYGIEYDSNYFNHHDV